MLIVIIFPSGFFLLCLISSTRFTSPTKNGEAKMLEDIASFHVFHVLK